MLVSWFSNPQINKHRFEPPKGRDFVETIHSLASSACKVRQVRKYIISKRKAGNEL
jgi:hypothetical protein